MLFISTVLTHNIKQHHLVFNPKRFNVAVTRAKVRHYPTSLPICLPACNTYVHIYPRPCSSSSATRSPCWTTPRGARCSRTPSSSAHTEAARTRS